MAKSGREAREEREKMIILKHKFENRITIAKIGKECLDAGDYGSALKRFVEYMEILSEAKRAKDMFSIKPQHFDPKKDLTEMLLISHIYFEMARIYDAVPKFAEEAKRCLDQFLVFTANQPYQVVNSELIRKHLKKSAFKNAEYFRTSYQQIHVQSKKCYVVTFCYGNDHLITQEYRQFKDWMLNYRLGQELVRIYYLYSSSAVTRWEKSPWMHFIARIFISPMLHVFSKTILRFILPKC